MGQGQEPIGHGRGRRLVQLLVDRPLLARHPVDRIWGVKSLGLPLAGATMPFMERTAVPAREREFSIPLSPPIQVRRVPVGRRARWARCPSLSACRRGRGGLASAVTGRLCGASKRHTPATIDWILICGS